MIDERDPGGSLRRNLVTPIGNQIPARRDAASSESAGGRGVVQHEHVGAGLRPSRALRIRLAERVARPSAADVLILPGAEDHDLILHGEFL
ncbi:MAG TPA: hypothetical protein VMH81_20350 [Bryobacteraceae bacterium]|nr:hypothetical protein [Bryobacteraceae bacterium]